MVRGEGGEGGRLGEEEEEGRGLDRNAWTIFIIHRFRPETEIFDFAAK